MSIISSFIERANSKHNGKYDYSLVDYKVVKDKVQIICPIHGLYIQRVDVHLGGGECPKCGLINRDIRRKANRKPKDTRMKDLELKYPIPYNSNGEINYKEFFMSDPKSGWKCVEKKLKNNFPEIHQNIIEFISECPELINLSFKEKVWHFLNNVHEIPICEECGKKLKFWRSLQEGYPVFCSILCGNINKERIERIKETNLKTHGVTCSLRFPEVIEVTEKKVMELYGVKNYFELKDRAREDFFKKYGADSPMKVKEIVEKINETVLKRYGVKNYIELDSVRNKAHETQRKNYLEKYAHLEIISKIGEEVTIHCPECNKDYTISNGLLNYRYKYNVEPCTICNPLNSHTSYHEKEMAKFIRDELKMNIDENNRTVIKPYEIDIYLPDKKLGVEFDGLFWHSDAKQPSNYHQMKLNLANEKGVQIINVYQDEWIFKSDIIKSILRSKLGMIERKINSEDCKIKEISDKVKAEFLNENYIDGDYYEENDIKLGFFHEKELILVATLRQTEDNIEIVKFVHKLNTMTIYAFKALLDYIKKKFNPKRISSIVDLRHSNGNLFTKYGFKMIEKIEPDFWFVDDMFRIPKEGIEEDCGFNKIYDCGKLKYQLILD